jgi:hypothetical protein
MLCKSEFEFFSSGSGDSLQPAAVNVLALRAKINNGDEVPGAQDQPAPRQNPA